MRVKNSYNIKDNFENVYLRSRTLARYLSKADPEIMNDPGFKRCVSHITSVFYKKQSYLFKISGFEYEDILSIARIFGLAFMGGYGYKINDAHDRNIIMLNYIGQRLSRMVEWVARKFQANEIEKKKMINIENSPHDNPDKVTRSIFKNQLNIFSSLVVDIDGRTPFGCDKYNPEDKIEELEEYLLGLRTSIIGMRNKINVIKNKSEKNDLLIYKHQLTAQKKKFEKELAALRSKRFKERRSNTKRLQELRDLLDKNPEKYQNDLSYYSISKAVGSDVRKKARKLCNKYGINYIVWAEAYIKRNNYDKSDFVL